MFIIFLTNFTIAAYTCFSSSTLSCGDTGYYSNNILFPSFSLLSKTQLIYHSSTKNAHLATYTKQTHLISLISGLKTKLTKVNITKWNQRYTPHVPLLRRGQCRIRFDRQRHNVHTEKKSALKSFCLVIKRVHSVKIASLYL